MNIESQIKVLAVDFLKHYDAESEDLIWRQQSKQFREFWVNRILADGLDAISEADCDKIIRMLDSSAKGNAKGNNHSVAKTMVRQNEWRILFAEFRSNKQLASLLLKIFEENNPTLKAHLIDQLYAQNEGNKNRLTGPSGITVNALLAAYDPVHNLCAVSINHRLALIDFLEIETPFDREMASPGVLFVQSNILLSNAFQSLGFNGSMRTASCFCYSKKMFALWNKGNGILPIQLTIHDFTPTADDEQLNIRSTRLIRHGNIAKPQGIKQPKRVSSSCDAFIRDPVVRAWVLQSAGDQCEACSQQAPFRKNDGLPFLEVHHVRPLAEDGPDQIENAVAICPNCHRRFHHSSDREQFKEAIYAKISRLVRE